jgi:hypothetical protein|nr:MAG TPA: Middle operon regulator, TRANSCRIPTION.2A [Bacteriophage sp.]
MRQTQRKERDKVIKSEYREMVRCGSPIWETKEQLAAKYGMCSQSIHRIVNSRRAKNRQVKNS